MKIENRVRNIAFILFAISVVILIIVIFTVFPNLINGTLGSFEYVRKGEALLDQGKYLEAIGYYEKAYDSSPGSEIIRNSLVNAYSSYAVAMSENEKYDVSIQYLSMAFSILPNAYTRQNLALMYGKKALLEAKASDWSRAQECLDAAREVAEGSTASARSLGIALFNDAVGEFKSSSEDSAILLLKEAALVYSDSRILEFLSDIYYKRNDLDNVLLYLDKAIKADPENVKLSEKHEKVIKEKALSESERIKVLPYFDMRYDEDLSVNADVMAKILERAYFDIGKDLSYLPKSRTVVFFYSEKNFREIFKMGDMVMAFYDGNIRIPIPVSVSDEKELSSYLYHEYTHAIISAMTNNNCPIWLSEGIAVYEEVKRTRPGAAASIPESAIAGSGISIQALDDAFRDPEVNSEKLVLSYILARTAVEYIVENWGSKALDGVLAKISSGSHAVNAIDDELLLSEKEFNRRWSDFVVKKYVNKEGGK